MKFDDIPKLISPRNQPNNLDLCEIDSALKHLEEDYGLNLDPEFQRGHVWTSDQQSKFMEFILRGGKCPPLMFNSPAYGGNYRKPEWDLGDEVVIVDGKQRLTACLLFLRNAVEVFGGKVLSDFEEGRIITRRTGITYQVNNLTTKRDLLTWYLEMNEGHIAHTPEEISRVKLLLEKEPIK
jgi:uncharacterized protein with ParB-like and HNH nuclease domain